jgi:Zn-dependent M16 (insulinase) family peptidase
MSRLSLLLRLMLPAILVALMIASHAQAQPVTALKGLKQGDVVEGFRADAVYLNDAGDAMGGRFVHQGTGFTLDLLRLQSVPQSFIWVTSFPTSDMGEPHTQEHLLLGKGNKGRAVAGLEDAMLVGSSAFTAQWRTAYHFHTGAGADAYFTVLERQLDALLHPDYTDEEIRREVANFGVVDNPDGTLSLEEKGTVYQEMVSSFERPWSRMSRALGHAIYGTSHPLTYVSGGLPEAIRRMQPEDIRRFHAATHHLANMGMVASFPRAMGVEETLRRIGALLDRVEPGGGREMRFTRLEDLPAPSAAAPGTIVIGEYPNRNASQAGPVILAWPADRKLGVEDRMVLQLFLQSFAGDATTNLYKCLVDSRTRSIDVGASDVFGWVDSDPGNPISIGLSDVDPTHMTEAGLERIRGEIRKELEHVASLLDDSPEVRELNARVRSRIVEQRRAMSKFVNSPPRFGFRNTGSEWMEHLRELEGISGFEKSVTLRPQLDRIEEMLSSNRNIWPELIAKWGLLARQPYVAAARPSPALVEREAAERRERSAAEIARLRAKYRASNDQETIKRYRADYDAMTAVLDSLTAAAKTARFIDNPPLTLDDELDFTVGSLGSGGTLVSSHFDDMTSSTVGIALRLDAVPQEDLFLISMMPELLTQTGVMIDGKGLPYEEMSERLRREVLGVGASFSASFATGRAELVMTASGNDVKETDRAIEWMGMMLTSPYWAEKNLGRVRDVVEQRLSSLRNTMQDREEAWVNDPAASWWRQDHPLLLATSSFLTRSHNALRLKWLLADPGSAASRPALTGWLTQLSQAADGSNRQSLESLLGSIQGDSSAKPLPRHLTLEKGFRKLPDDARAIALDVARDLGFALNEIPDNSLQSDWKYLVGMIRTNLVVDPLEAMSRLDRVRRSLLKKSAVRAWVVGSHTAEAKLMPKLDMLVGTFAAGPFVPARYQIDRMIAKRLRERGGLSKDPTFVGLVNPSTSSGVFINSAPATSYRDTDREALVDFLSSMLYSGGAGHGIFMKTWAAGLAYSNGIRVSPRSGRVVYYAERVPVLPQTLRFVIDELRKAQPDTSLVDYAIAQAFQESRAAASFESRGEAMAADIADGLTPDVIRAFRKGILALRNEPDLARKLVERMPDVLGRVLPGYGPKVSANPDAIQFVIGPDEQIQKLEEYLKTVEGAGTRVERIYPRDYWMGEPVRGE